MSPLDVKPGDEVTIVNARAGTEKIARVERITPSGLIVAGGALWRADGRERAAGAAWRRRRLVPTTLEHKVAVLALDIARGAERVASLYASLDVARVSLSLPALEGVREQLRQIAQEAADEIERQTERDSDGNGERRR